MRQSMLRAKVRGDQQRKNSRSAVTGCIPTARVTAPRSHYDRYYFIRRHDNWRGALASALASLAAAATALADSVSRWVTLVLAWCAVHSFGAVSVRLALGNPFSNCALAFNAGADQQLILRSAWNFAGWISQYRGKSRLRIERSDHLLIFCLLIVQVRRAYWNGHAPGLSQIFWLTKIRSAAISTIQALFIF